jgi:hypothetical protein
MARFNPSVYERTRANPYPAPTAGTSPRPPRPVGYGKGVHISDEHMELLRDIFYIQGCTHPNLDELLLLKEILGW